MEKLSRRTFLHASAGVASGAAIAAAPAALILGGSPAVEKPEPGGVVVTPSTPLPREPLMAYVRDVERAEVTVLSGTTETTYRDPVLVRRLLKALATTTDADPIGGGLDVVAP
jgi:hypothetical protein